MNKEVITTLMKVLMSLKNLSEETIIWICGEIRTIEQATELVKHLKVNQDMTESEILKLTKKIINI